MEPFRTEYGYLCKDNATGYIDGDTRYPANKKYTEDTPLVSGYSWVKVEITYREITEDYEYVG